ncbi:MAG: sodium:proton antiporter [Sphingobacteriia bacterium]|nr:sodium:proton antiporter [Sphingobacteriia bacterium]NCC39023.1 sodium:proton antiporter [Gammaproteobacteria bacterium]
MRLFDILALLIGFTALFSWLNDRFLKLPHAIGLMLIALVFSLLLQIQLPFTQLLHEEVALMLDSIDLGETLLEGMLGFLLFAGALHVNLHDLAKHRLAIALLASASVLGSTLLVGIGSYLLFLVIGLEIPLIYCLLLGALISPTDPIAVLGILKSAQAPKELETKITGESLFNDGVAVVVFMVLLGLAAGKANLGIMGTLMLLATEIIGGVLFGLALGWLALIMIRHTDNYQVEIMITLALAMSGYAIAEHAHVSAPIAIVIAGLLIGNRGRKHALTARTLYRLDDFWELVDTILNAVLFVLIGLEILIISVTGDLLLAGLLAIPLVLLARLISVGVPIRAMARTHPFAPGVVPILTWGGLRGGVSIALALSLPESEARDPLLTVTYILVIFSVLVQGLTLGPFVRAVTARANRAVRHPVSNPTLHDDQSTRRLEP